MKRVLLGVLALGALGALTGCQSANISATLRASDRENAAMETRCESCDMRSNSEMQEILTKYDGWRVIYISEYTTGNKFGTAGVICLERPKK